jgi:hypothetical protein
VSYTYDIPIGRGRKLWSGASPVADKFVGGWAVNGIYTAQSGTPLFLTTAVNLTNSFGGGSRPDSLGRSAKLEGPAQQRLGRWFDTSAFAQSGQSNISTFSSERNSSTYSTGFNSGFPAMHWERRSSEW